MFAPFLALLQVLQPAAAPSAPTYDGRAGQTIVYAPRVEVEIAVDGVLDEPAWAHAARLRGFSQYLPADGVPAADSTVVLVVYSKHAIYFGIRAYEAHGAVHATLADRDKIQSDDYVQIILDTSHDHKKAYVFGVNPFGVQADGILSEGIQTRASGLGGPAPVRDTVDLSTDYTYQSRGHLTDTGYDVEIRIPFSSISFTSGSAQRWGINIVRQVQHSGYQDTWAPARQANASFIGQSGTLDGLTDISRGLVLDVNPELTSHVDGGARPGGWHYGTEPLHPGGNVRWGVTDNLTVDGTVRPDFSQIEADVPQLQYDPRVALFFPEKRPFFLDGLEQFDTSNSLVYTRQVVQPDGALKLTGEVAGTSLGLLSAVDSYTASASGHDHPVFNILRARHQLGPSITLGALVADREEGRDYNHVGGLDARVVLGDIYDLRLQGALSNTRSPVGDQGNGGLWSAIFERNGHHLRLHYALNALDPHFVDQSGFIGRTGVVNSTLQNSWTAYGSPGARIESYTFDFSQITTWRYDQFQKFHRGEDVRWHFSNAVTLHGGWQVVGNVFIETYGYDPSLYATYAIARPRPGGGVDTLPYTGVANIPNVDIVTGFTTPRWAGFDATIQTVTGLDENFYEWSQAWIFDVNATINWRPTDRARLSLIYSQQQYVRHSNWTQVAVQRVPYVVVAYQVARPIYVRFIGQYDASWRDALRDDGRTNAPILIRDPVTGVYAPALRTLSNAVRGDWLFSYQPTPGTVCFLGYGSGYTEPFSFNFTGLHRTNDGFFIKLTYLFHVGR